MKKRLLSGIKPTGDLHIGNYFGAMRQQVSLLTSGEYECYIMVADYHALNTMQNKEEMGRRIRELVLAYMAVGLDPKKVILFKQSDVPAHTELAWIFDTITTMPYLMRAHAYKDAEAKNREISVGTFNYPMLMAADILLYDTNIVPVGQDQKQHIEYARDTAEKFNRTFENTFILPEHHIMPDVAIVPGTDGQKMSKSYGNVIPLFGSREDITKAVMSIVTNSDGGKPLALYNIHKLVRAESELEGPYGAGGNFKQLKEMLIDDLDAFIKPMREKYAMYSKQKGLVEKVLKEGAKKANKVTEAKMNQVRTAIGVNLS